MSFRSLILSSLVVASGALFTACGGPQGDASLDSDVTATSDDALKPGEAAKCKDTSHVSAVADSHSGGDGAGVNTITYVAHAKSGDEGGCRNDPGYNGALFVITRNGDNQGMQMYPALAGAMQGELRSAASKGASVWINHHVNQQIVHYRQFTPAGARDLADKIQASCTAHGGC